MKIKSSYTISSILLKSSFLFSLFFLPALIMAQTWEGDGSLEKVEVEIVKERQVSVPPASRNYEKFLLVL
ncbi:MAG: hypothetical protein HC811_02140 [Flammeovirgaceae bacterium]|nr:hypothetical protein [Flammeovirgaceae bacterium]